MAAEPMAVTGKAQGEKQNPSAGILPAVGQGVGIAPHGN